MPKNYFFFLAKLHFVIVGVRDFFEIANHFNNKQETNWQTTTQDILFGKFTKIKNQIPSYVFILIIKQLI